MAKKKKTQLKPVERGFATTSLPKKIAPPEQSFQDLTPVKPPDDNPPQSNESTVQSIGETVAPVIASPNGQPPMSAEDLYLQNLLEKLQEKTEKEISRSLKAIEVDRRYSQALPRLDIDSALRDRLLDYALISNEGEGQKSIEETEEKALSRLGITYGILRRLGFREERVDECLRCISGLDIEDAFNWLYLHCTEDELLSKDSGFQKPLDLKLAAGITVRRHFTPPSTPHAPPGSLSRGNLSDEAPETSTKSKYSSPEKKEQPVGASTTREYVTEDIIRIVSADEDPVSSTNDESDVDADTLEYVRLKLLEDELSSDPSGPIDKARRAQLRRRMDEISNDYLFDKKDALSRYSREKKKAERDLLHHRLKSSHWENTSETMLPSTPVGEAAAPSKAPHASSSVVWDDNDSDDSSTGMLGILEEPDPKELTIQGVTFTLRDMALPKHWSGPMPKTLLRDFVFKSDRYAAISYTTISGHSRAKRASLSISWHNKTRDEWSMDEVACSDDSQAEQYVATVALHSLTYPVTEGFIASSPATAGSATSFRLLPPVYRDLWDELEASRKTRDEMANRTTWAKLLNILKDKAFKATKSVDRQSRAITDKLSQSVSRANVENTSSFDAAAAAFRARQTTPVYQEILAQRNRLPIAHYRDRIIDTLEHSQVLVLSGETGCGKSTQVPSFLLEDSLSKGRPCRIFCTEPRRISAMSLAQRVAYELCDPPNFPTTHNSLVGYSIRLESHISRNTRLAFVTNGIALRMLEGGTGQNGNGTAFDEITHLVIDEVHERSIESDFLLIVLKSLLLERPDLKVILMSATLDAEKISSYFGNGETLQVPGRTFPVEVQYLEDAIEYTKWFITESSPYARRLHDKYYRGKSRPEWTEDIPSLDEEDDDSSDSKSPGQVKLEKRYSSETAITLNTIDERLIPYDLVVRLLEKICYEDLKYRHFSAAVLIFMPGLGEIRRLHDLLVEHPVFGSNDFKLYPLHSSLSTESQGAVFDVPPAGIRKIVIATNIAETGITIPDITCVIDTGKHREMRFDEKRQISRLVETFIAKSNAAQRRGRAGRVQHGLCFHLFTKLRHDTQMAESPLPEMLRLSLSDLALRIKIMKVNLGPSIEEVLARALDPPVSVNVQRAVSMLIEVRALTPSEEITPMGRLLSKLPTDVHLGKFLLVSSIFGCLDSALTIAATLNSKSPFVAPLGLEQEADRARNSFRVENSDFLTIHNAFSSWRRACANPGISRFCRTNFLSHQNLQQIEDLRQQFLGYLIDSSFIQVDTSLVRELSRARYGRNRTRFVTIPSELNINSNKPALVHAALAAGLYPKILSIDSKTRQLRTISNNQSASFHPTSVNFRRNPLDFGVNYLTYFTLMHSKKLYAWETGPVDDLSILLLCGEADHKLISNTVSIDRKIRFSVPPKTHIALKILREKVHAILAQQYQGRALTDMQLKWMETCLLALGKTRLTPEKDEPAISIR